MKPPAVAPARQREVVFWEKETMRAFCKSAGMFLYFVKEAGAYFSLKKSTK